MIKEGIEKEGVSRTFLHIRQLLLLQGCCLEGLVQVLAWTYSRGKPALVTRLDL